MANSQSDAGSNAVVEHKRVNIDEPRWDQSTYVGRAKHFFVTTNPFNILRTGAELQKAKEVVDAYR